MSDQICPSDTIAKCPANACRLMSQLILVSVAAIGFAGCQSSRSDKMNATAKSMGLSASNETAQKTEFHREVSTDQQLNVHLELGRVYESQGNFEAAIAEYQKAIDVCEKKGVRFESSKTGREPHALAERRLAAAFDRVGRFAQSEVHYQKALKLAPKDSNIWNNAGYSYYLQDRYVDAERALKTSDSLNPNNQRTLTNLGLVLAAQGKDVEALAALTRAGGPAIGHANLGFILAAMGKSGQARSHYEKALALQPGLTAASHAIVKLDKTARDKPTTVVDASYRDERVGKVSAIPLPKPRSPAVAKPDHGNARDIKVRKPTAKLPPTSSLEKAPDKSKKSQTTGQAL